jgi:hypothetical protein
MSSMNCELSCNNGLQVFTKGFDKDLVCLLTAKAFKLDPRGKVLMHWTAICYESDAMTFWEFFSHEVMLAFIVVLTSKWIKGFFVIG